METKINIAEILKDKPRGTKLYDRLYNVDVELETIRTIDTTVWCTNETNNKTTCYHGYSEFGTARGCPDGLQILKPSKEMQDWEKFTWKKGDVLVSNDNTTKVIFNGWKDDTYTLFMGAYALITHNDGKIEFGSDSLIFETCNYKGIEVEDAAQSYINYIERRLGGKLNLETLEIENAQPEFKDGDVVCISGMGYLAYGIVKSIDNSSKKLEYYVLNDMSTLKIDDWLSFEDKQIQPITETQRIILFDALAKENKAWDAEKKQIVDLKPNWTPKTFDRVITRDFDDGVWSANIFSHMNSQGEYVSIGCVEGYAYCLPYNEETAKLIGTTNNAK